MKKKSMQSIKLLNGPGHHGTASIAMQFNAGPYKNLDKNVILSVDGTVSISDCSRKISLDFDYSSKASHRNALRKAKILMEEATKVYSFIKDNPYYEEGLSEE